MKGAIEIASCVMMYTLGFMKIVKGVQAILMTQQFVRL
jgi:hypothetical protein